MRQGGSDTEWKNPCQLISPQKIRDGFSRKLFTVKSAEKYKLINALRKYPGTITAYPFGDSVHVTLNE